jgi:uncharacterized protein (DUF2147 family)
MSPKKLKAKSTTKRGARQAPRKRAKLDEYGARAAREKHFQAEAAMLAADAEATARIVGTMTTPSGPDVDSASRETIAQMEALRDRILNAEPPR